MRASQAQTEAGAQAKPMSEGTRGMAAVQGQQRAGRHSMTPELVSEEHLIGEHRSERAQAEDAEHAAPCQRLFPIFRPKSQWKVGQLLQCRTCLPRLLPHQTMSTLCESSSAEDPS